MGHMIDSFDVIDILEEAVVTRKPVVVELAGGGTFTDRVRDVVTEAGQDFAEFKDHGRVAVKDIRGANRQPPQEAPEPGAPMAEQPTVNNRR